MTFEAEKMPLGTTIRVRSARLTLRLEHGRKPWRAVAGGPGRFSHAEVNGSADDGDVDVITVPEGDVAAI